MSYYHSIGRTLPGAYHDALCTLWAYGKKVPCPDWDTERKEIPITISVLHPIEEPMISKLFIGGPEDLESYRLEMLHGIRDYEIQTGKWEYTYHDRFAKQFDWVVTELKRNPYSSRAIMDIYRPDMDSGSGDPPCMNHVQYFIRNGKLDCFVLFRSNDACKAAFMNMLAMIMLQERLARILGVGVGEYTHTANSFHCYERDYDILDSYHNRIRGNLVSDLSYHYFGDWKEMMDEASPEILNAANKKFLEYEDKGVIFSRESV